LEMDGNVFSIIGTKPQALISRTDSTVSWKIDAKDIPLNGGVIAEIKGRALVTKHRKSPLHFSSIIPETNRSVTINQKDGSLNVSPTCGNSLTGFKQMSVLSARVLPPHPIQSEISIAYRSTSQEEAVGEIAIYSLQGAKLYSASIIGNEQEQVYIIPQVFSRGTYIFEVKNSFTIHRELIMIAP